MAIKIKHIDPKITDFGPNDIVINIKTGDIFYKSEKNLFKLKGDNLNTPFDTLNLQSNMSALKGFFEGPTLGTMVIESKNGNPFKINGVGSLEVKGSIFPTASAEPQYDLGNIQRPWRDIFVSEGSFKFVKKDRGVGHSKIGSSFIVGAYRFENTKEFTTFTKENVDDLKQGKSISGSGDLRVTGRARIDSQLRLDAGLNIIAGGITGSIDGGSF